VLLTTAAIGIGRAVTFACAPSTAVVVACVSRRGLQRARRPWTVDGEEPERQSAQPGYPAAPASVTEADAIPGFPPKRSTPTVTMAHNM